MRTPHPRPSLRPTRLSRPAPLALVALSVVWSLAAVSSGLLGCGRAADSPPGAAGLPAAPLVEARPGAVAPSGASLGPGAPSPAARHGSTLTPPARVVSLTPAACALVGALGRGDRLVGSTQHCELPGAPRNLDIRPDLERVLALRPDLVVIGSYPFNRPAIEQLTAAGLPVLAVPLTSLDDLRAALDALGARLDAPAAARRLRTALDDGLARARALAAAAPGPPPRVLLVYEVADGYVYTSGGGDHLESLLRACDATNVAAPGPLTARLSIERVLTLAPGVILHTAPTRALPDRAAALAYWRRVAPSLPAVQAGRVLVWPDGSLAQPGPKLAQAVVRLARLLRAPPSSSAHPGAP